MKTTVLTSTEELAGFRENWLRLRTANGELAPNSDPDRYTTALLYLKNGALPYVLALQDAAGPCGA